MSYGGLPLNIYLNYAKSIGAYYQLPLFETPPHYEIKEEYLCFVYAGYNCTIDETGSSHSITKHIDHPSFTTLREHLGSKGYIKIEDKWCNGDRVTKEFVLNGKTFYENDEFPCAGAMKNHLKYKD